MSEEGKREHAHLYCAVTNCKNNSLNFFGTFHRFPAVKERAETWAKLCKREDLLERNVNLNNFRICSKHFEKEMFKIVGRTKRKLLISSACPTIFPQRKRRLLSKEFKENKIPGTSKEDLRISSTSKFVDVPTSSTEYLLDTINPVVLEKDDSTGNVITTNDKIVQKNNELDVTNGVVLDHDYAKKHEQEKNKNDKSNISLTINLTEYSQHVDVKNICGVVLMLKDNALPVSSHTDESNVYLPVSSANINAVSRNEAVKQDFKCQRCSMVFYSKEVLRNHIRRHHNIGFKYRCPKCPKRYQSLVLLSSHIKRVHGYHCEFCKGRFRLLAAYKEHIRENHKEVFYNHCKPYYCRACDTKFNNKGIFLKHLHGHGGCLCYVCLEIFSTKDEYKAHEETHPNKYFCEICTKGFKEESSLKAHTEVHNSPYSFPCPHCDKTFKTKSTLRLHVLIHNPQKNFMCDKCSKMCRTENQLKRHLKQVHDKIRDFQCTECNKKFFTGAYLKMHYNITHLKLRPYQCEFCGKQFARKDFLLAHRKIHTKKAKERSKPSKITELLRKMIPDGFSKYKDQPVECLICGRTLKNVSTLKAHLNTHIRLRKFKCQYCGLMFLHQTSKIRHEKSHEADPEHKFICPVCWKRMKTKEILDAHMDEHNRPKRHFCNVCCEAFSRRLLLDNHILSEHTTEEDIGQKEQFILEGLEQAVNI